MRAKLVEDPDKDRLTVVQVELGLKEYGALRKLLKLGINSDSAERVLDKTDMRLASRFTAVLFDTDDEVDTAIEAVKRDVPHELQELYIDPHSFCDEEFMVAGILKIPDDKIEHVPEGEGDGGEDDTGSSP